MIHLLEIGRFTVDAHFSPRSEAGNGTFIREE
jgi:hypothetical protein